MLSLHYLARRPFSRAIEAIPSTVGCASGAVNLQFRPVQVSGFGIRQPGYLRFYGAHAQFFAFFNPNLRQSPSNL
jgi:hypothetical protein